MIQESPWLGHGAGIFSLLYPQYRLPGEISSGKFAHNDYLHIWLEMGLPALLLLAALLLITAITFRKAWYRSASIPKRLEISGLFCGLFSVALHSLFTFNLYILSILVLSGLFLGRLNQLCTTDHDLFTLDLRQYMKPALTRWLVVIITLVILILLTFDWAHQYYYRRAIAEYKQRQFDNADKSFTLSRRFNATNASLVSHANLLIDSISTWPKSEQKMRQALFDEALQLLDKAEAINPLKVHQYLARGRLYTSYPELAGEDYLKLARNAYRHSLSLNPRLYQSRYILAKLLLAENRESEALEVLEQGLIETYLPAQNISPYLQLTMSLRLKQGHDAGARELARSIQQRQAEAEREDIETILNAGAPGESEELEMTLDPPELTISE
jgi:hypothetical protein